MHRARTSADPDTPARRSTYAYATPARTRNAAGASGSRAPSRGGAATPSARRDRGERAFEIGDMVRLDGTSLMGVLRYIGPVHGRDGHFAGLELTGSSYGHGKNDGTIDGWQYFATEPNNGVFGPVSKLVPLSTKRPTSATARPLSALAAGRASRNETQPRNAEGTPRQRRVSGVPVPSSVPRAAPRKSMGVPARNLAGTPRRPLSSAAGHRPTRQHDDSFVFDDEPKATPDAEKRQTLLEQLALPSSKDAIADMDTDHAVPIADYERLCDELAEMRRQHTMWDEERAELLLAAQKRENELEATKRLELEDEVRQRHIFETRALELQRQLNEALDTATAAADAHDELERKASEYTDRIVDLETALAAVQLRAEHPPNKDSDTTAVDAQKELAQLHAKVETMMAGWNRERADLTDKIAELQRAGNETISMFEQQLAQAHDERDAALRAAKPDDTVGEIDKASLTEQVAHLQDKVDVLEEEVNDARLALERTREEHAKAKKELETVAADAKAQVAQLEKSLSAAEERANKVQLALDECHAGWQRDQAELESLREAPVTPKMPADVNDRTMDSAVVQALEARISQLEREKAEQHSHFTKEVAELESLVESRIFREDELETELEQLRAQARSS